MTFLEALKFGMRLLINKRIIPGACAIIRNSKGEILLGKREENSITYPDFWGLPGGIIEYGETIEKTIRRELKEELGVESRFLKQGKVSMNLPSKARGIQYLSLVTYCSITGKPKPGDETSEVKWFKPKEIKNMQLAYDHKKILKQEKLI